MLKTPKNLIFKSCYIKFNLLEMRYESQIKIYEQLLKKTAIYEYPSITLFALHATSP